MASGLYFSCGSILISQRSLFWERIRNRPNTYPINVDSIDAKLGNLIGYDRIYIVRARSFFRCWFNTLPFLIAVILAGLVGFSFAFLVGYPCLRVRGPYFVILTFGLAELVKFIVINVEAGLGKFGRLLLGAPGLETLYYLILALAVISIAITYYVRRSRFGAALRAIREDEEAAETLGIDVARFKVLAFAISATVPSMVGAVMILRNSYFEPLDVFNPVTSFTIVSMAIIGGGDDVPGPIYGALGLVLLQEVLWANWPEVYMIILGVLLVTFVLRVPEGIHGWILSYQRSRTT